MKIRLTAGYLLAFAALVIVTKELHELSHIIPSRLICGCWGAARDFNLISFCEPCLQENPLILIAGFGGPAFTYLTMWVGLWLLLQPNLNKKWLGFTLVFVSKPFARLFTALVGGGDEYGAFRQIFGGSIPAVAIQVLCVVAILVLIIPPLIVAFKNIRNKYKGLWFTGFFILPMIFDFVVVMGYFNSLLKKGILADNFIFATPWLVHIVFWISIGMVIVLHKHLVYYPKERSTTSGTDLSVVPQQPL